MLSYKDCEEWEGYLLDEVEVRTLRGGYNADAPTILELCTVCLALIKHVKNTIKPESRPKTQKKKR